jgi:hypothetical protein
MLVVLRQIAAAHTTAVLTAQNLQIEALTIHLKTLGFPTVTAKLLHLLYFVQPFPFLGAAAHLPARSRYASFPNLHLLLYGIL